MSEPTESEHLERVRDLLRIGGLTVKRVYVSDGSLVLTSDNPDRSAFPARAVSLRGSKQLQKILVGRVRRIGHEED